MFKSNKDPRFDASDRDPLFETLAQDLTDKGYSINTNALPNGLSQQLWDLQQSIPQAGYKKAGVGRRKDFNLDAFIRKDEISWIDDRTNAGAAWNQWAGAVQAFLNARLYLGLGSFESHFSRYTSGDFYRKHKDAFIGRSNRKLSIIAYLNRDWVTADAGELVLFTGDEGDTPIIVAPQFGTMVVFLSEEISHEVLMTNCDRFSIAGWFRVNGLNQTRIGPFG